MKTLMLFFFLFSKPEPGTISFSSATSFFSEHLISTTGLGYLSETSEPEEENQEISAQGFTGSEAAAALDPEPKAIAPAGKFAGRFQNFYSQNAPFLFLFAAIILGLSYLFISNRRKLTKRLHSKRHTLHQHIVRAQAILEAEDKERKRIGLELHDGLGQLITIAKLNLTGLQEEINFTDETHKALLRNTLNVLDEAFKEVRNVSHNLVAGGLQQQALPAALRHLLDTISQTDRYEVHFETVGFSQEKLPTMVEKVIYRVVQECLNNILKHAHATTISVQLIRHEKELTLMIEDNGTGFDQQNLPESEGIGLKNIRSRIEYLNGTVHIDSVFKRGTILTVEIPLAAPNPKSKKLNEKFVTQHSVAVS